MLPGGLAAQLGLAEAKGLPYTNTRLVLSSEVTDDDYFFGGCVVRCWTDPNSHPAVKQTLQGLDFRCAGAGAAMTRACKPHGRRPTGTDTLLAFLAALQACEPRRPGRSGNREQARCAPALPAPPARRRFRLRGGRCVSCGSSRRLPRSAHPVPLLPHRLQGLMALWA